MLFKSTRFAALLAALSTSTALVAHGHPHLIRREDMGFGGFISGLFKSSSNSVAPSTGQFQACTQTQIKDIQEAIPAADKIQKDAWSYLQGLGPNPDPKNTKLKRYEKWFGSFSPNRYKTVYNLIRVLPQSHLSKAKYICRPESYTSCKASNSDFTTIAYVQENTIGEVNICPGFKTQLFRRSPSDLGKILFHEWTHFAWKKIDSSILGAIDVRDFDGGAYYAKTDCKNLAKTEAGNAVMNAENYACFAANLRR
ncbi:hypothetical protein HGRIS_011130 [Hohenbuehelia grisea]|uniref:Lysine-specific metallo-endopeptidase domain-containing protein n=1 Tax=Hohenbuehelia grisea TaxID=104357 RepID=A0ABR3IYY4_9AGAR